MASQSVYVYDTLEALTQGTIPGEFSGTIFNFPTITSTNSHGKKMLWTISVYLLNSDNKKVKVKDSYLKQPVSQLDGFTGVISVDSHLEGRPSRVAVETFITTGKNIGKKNATNVITQAFRDALGKYTNKLKTASADTVEDQNKGEMYPPVLIKKNGDTQGNTWVVKDTIVEPTNLFRLTSAYAVNIAGGAGANTVTGNFSAAVTNRAIIMGEIRGAAVAPFDVSGGQNQGGGGPGTGTDAVTTGNVTPTKSPSLVYALGMACGNNVMSAGTGFTLGQQLSAILSSSVSLATENKRLTSTSAQAATFTQSTALRTLALQMVFDELVAGGFGLSQLSNQGGF
jgi:hypothetical protein